MKVIWILLALSACGGDAGTAAHPDARPTDADGDGDGDGQLDDAASAPSIPGGAYLRGYDGVGYDDDSFPATVSGFGLDSYEVTVGRFRAFVSAGKGVSSSAPIAGTGAHAKISGSGWDAAWSPSLAASSADLTAALLCHATYQTWTDAPGPSESLPINCVTWYEAMAFCIWDGGYLPTDAEWNYAAAGGDEQRAYPWSIPASSTTINSTYANYGDGGTNLIKDVGSTAKGDGMWDQSDLAGNISEWLLDWYEVAYPMPCVDCANLSAASSRVYRGGNFSNIPGMLRVAGRNGRPPTDRNAGIGIRCARAL